METLNNKNLLEMLETKTLKSLWKTLEKMQEKENCNETMRAVENALENRGWVVAYDCNGIARGFMRIAINKETKLEII